MHVVIDERLLKDDELVEYGRINKLSFSENDIVVLVILGLTYPALTVFLGVQSEQLKGDSSDLDSLFSLLALVALVTGWMVPLWAWNRGSENAKRARDERRWEFRQSLSGYDYRRPRRAVPDPGKIIDPLFLESSDERFIYQTLNRAGPATKHKAIVALAVLGYLVLFAGTLTNAITDPQGNGGASPSFALFMVCASLGWIPVPCLYMHGIAEATRDRDYKLREFAKSIGYEERLPRELRSGGSGYGPTQRQMQHEWYEGHSELGWQDRTRAEMYGMDVETYISNVAEYDND